MRRDSRVLAFKLVFERLFNTQPFDDELWEELNDKDKNLAEEIFEHYINHKKEIENKIENLLIGYSLSRIHKIDLALLSIAVAEIDYVKTPAPVVINEIIEIAKVYSSEEAPKFLNGILASIVKGNAEKDN